MPATGSAVSQLPDTSGRLLAKGGKLLVTEESSPNPAAPGVALFVWLALASPGAPALMGTAVTMRLDVGTLLALTLLNPLEAYRIGAIAAITGTLDVLGPAGVYASRTLGRGLVAVLAGVLVAWSVIPLVAAGLVFGRRGIR